MCLNSEKRQRTNQRKKLYAWKNEKYNAKSSKVTHL